MKEENILAQRINLLRGKDSFRTFGNKCGISDGSVRNMEAGKDVSLNILKKVSATYNKPISWLIGETDDDSHKTMAKVAATIEPGNHEKKQLLIDQRNKPTITNEGLRLFVKWMDTYFSEHPNQAFYFCEDMRERYPSYNELIEKKRESGNHLNTSPDVKSANGNE